MASLPPIPDSSDTYIPAVDFGTDTVWNKLLTDPINWLRSFVTAANPAPLSPPMYNTTPAVASLPPIPLSSGISIPAIGFGTGSVWNKPPTDPIDEALVSAIVSALKVGYRHLDCAERYNTASEVGLALSRAEVPRSDLFITTKVERNFANPGDGLRDQLHAMGTEYVDLYLIHQPFTPNVKTVWRALEALQREGLTRAIGVSNFNKSQLEELYGYAEIKPVVNQVELNPYCIDQELLSFCREKGIVAEGYAALAPLTKFKGGPLDAVVEEISNKVGKTPAQVLLRWVAQQGVVVLTTSSKEARQKELLDLGFELSEEDTERIRKEGAKEHHRRCWVRYFKED